tara:strand:+ start:3430 stop:4368 length:939 start_codon:yes stop_codon:yes gene_type:complete
MILDKEYKMKIAITGSNGFIGKQLKEMLLKMNYEIVTISNNTQSRNEIENYTYAEFFSGNIQLDIECILHLASPNYDFCKDDSLKKGITELTDKIVSSLYFYKCKKIIYFSSAKVYGEPSFDNNIFFEESSLNPETDYGKEKANAEEVIKKHAQLSGIDYLIYRMPMVYGPNMKSNIGSLMKIIKKSIPFPYFVIANNYKKSYLSIENIKRHIAFNIENPDSINQSILNLSDNHNYSLNDFIKKYKTTSGSRSAFIKLPNIIFLIFSKAPVLKNVLTKLYGSFVINNDKINQNNNIQILNLEEGLSSFINNE